MSTVIGIIAICLGLLFSWFVIKMIKGALTPPEVSGRQYLRGQLEKEGIGAMYVPDACLDELVAEAKTIAEMKDLMGKEYFRTEFLHGLDALVDMILTLRDNPNDTSFLDGQTRVSRYREILRRYRVA